MNVAWITRWTAERRFLRSAETRLARAIELDPNDPVSRGWHCMVLIEVGRVDEAIDQCRAAVRIDPTYPQANVALGSALMAARRYAEAERQLLHTRDLAPSWGFVSTLLMQLYLRSGRLAEAVPIAEGVVRAPRRVEQSSFELGWAGHVLARAGRVEEPRQILDELSRRIADGRFGSATDRALVHLGLGETEEAIGSLLQDQEFGDLVVGTAGVIGPEFASVRSDERIADIVRRIELSRSRTGS